MDSIVRDVAVAALLLSGVLAGLSLDKVIVQLPARHRMGAVAYAGYARAADLGFCQIVLAPGQVHVPSGGRPGVHHAGRARSSWLLSTERRARGGAGWVTARPTHRPVGRVISVRGVTMDLARWATAGSEGLLHMGGSMVERMWSTCEAAESADSDQARQRLTGGGRLLVEDVAVCVSGSVSRREGSSCRECVLLD